MCDAVERSSTSQQGDHGGMVSKANVCQPFRPPRNAVTGSIDQGASTVDSGGQTRPGVLVRPPSVSVRPPSVLVGPPSGQLSTDASGTATDSFGMEKPVQSLTQKTLGMVSGSLNRKTLGTVSGTVGQKTFGTVSGSLGSKTSGGHCTTASGPLRQLQLTDCLTLPTSVQQQLYLGQ